jgi:hypothetical protein
MAKSIKTAFWLALLAGLLVASGVRWDHVRQRWYDFQKRQTNISSGISDWG